MQEVKTWDYNAAALVKAAIESPFGIKLLQSDPSTTAKSFGFTLDENMALCGGTHSTGRDVDALRALRRPLATLFRADTGHIFWSAKSAAPLARQGSSREYIHGT